jgi:hypothetical protein
LDWTAPPRIAFAAACLGWYRFDPNQKRVTDTGCLITSRPEQFDTPEDFKFSGYVTWSQLLRPAQVRLGALDRYTIIVKISGLRHFPDAESTKWAFEAEHACNAKSSPQHRFSKKPILKGGREMAEKEHSLGTAISRAIQAERQSTVTTDRSSLTDILVNSPQWKKNALQRIESAQSGENDDTTPREACVQQAFKRIREKLARHLKELKDARRQLREQSATLQRRNEENEQLRQSIVKLEAEIANLTTEQRAERDAQRVELLQYQKAYDQFEQQTDLVLNELHQQNERLRVESRQRIRRSIHWKSARCQSGSARQRFWPLERAPCRNILRNSICWASAFSCEFIQ